MSHYSKTMLRKWGSKAAMPPQAQSSTGSQEEAMLLGEAPVGEKHSKEDGRQGEERKRGISRKERA